MIITSGKNYKDEPCSFFIERKLWENLEPCRQVVRTKDKDLVIVVAGLPGSGKSNFAMSTAKYLCSWFDISYIAFNAQQFGEIAMNCPNNSAIILDESYDDLGSQQSRKEEFQKFNSLLQQVRQKNLFIILCLPNFFDLSKGIAIYRSSFLFVCYEETFGDVGRFAGYGRDEKKKLYIKGKKFEDYLCEKPNIRGVFKQQTVLDEQLYQKMKLEHFKNTVNEEIDKTSKASTQRDRLLAYMHQILNISAADIMEIARIPHMTVYDGINRAKADILARYKPGEQNAKE